MKVIKKEATTTITIGTGILECLQKLLAYLLQNRSSEEVSLYTSEVEKHKSIQDKCSEEWMDHVKILSVMIATIEKQMIDENKVEEVDIN